MSSLFTVNGLHLRHNFWFPLTFYFTGVRHGPWRQSCNQILASFEVFSQTQSPLGNVERLGNRSGADVIGNSCIACLAHLIVLYDVVCRTDPTARSETHKLCDSALQRLGVLTSELHFDEHSYLDLLLGARPSLQTGGWDRSLGRNHYRSSTSA